MTCPFIGRGPDTTQSEWLVDQACSSSIHFISQSSFLSPSPSRRLVHPVVQSIFKASTSTFSSPSPFSTTHFSSIHAMDHCESFHLTYNHHSSRHPQRAEQNIRNVVLFDSSYASAGAVSISSPSLSRDGNLPNYPGAENWNAHKTNIE